ncbi:uncharacterized protein LOC110807364 isoform X2 [Carica papaya]|uniref:uncharacterized protein LOC110807364 isoform X2 n=1 Tax=Carica papaya TaxID=3649 RepID=UPI000B8D1AF1|nr:uncharacterized protein LOC110807364 isoform X2 [Carica papaya]
MWQALLAAAVAGSTGFLAKHFLGPNADRAVANLTDNAFHREKQAPEEPQTPPIKTTSIESACVSNCENGDAIFRFSSSGSTCKSECQSRSKILRKKVGARARRVIKSVGSAKTDKKSGAGLDLCRRRVAVSLKKMKTSKNDVKCGSCSNKDNSLFGWGLGVGIMYMMSAGKSEISKLNATMDETTKVVEELKTELYRRKSSRTIQVCSSANEVTANSKRISGNNRQLLLSKSINDNGGPQAINVSGLPTVDDGEYPSSVLTEEPEPELLEMDQLEAELECELQKLPWCFTEGSNDEAIRNNPSKADVSGNGFHALLEPGSESIQCHGVLPTELDKKLCHVLIEQQKNQIEELESELQKAQSKILQKEAELQALKDCVRRLTEFSLSTVSANSSYTSIPIPETLHL